jgi:8-oxo-dGTP diphosphatase
MTEGAIQIAVAVVEENGRFLIGRRPKGGVLAGFWEFPGGKVEPGETPGECALRECFEEAGIEVALTGRLTDCVHIYDYGTVNLHFYHCRPTSNVGTTPRPPFCWVPRLELGGYQFPPANAEVLRLLGVTPAENRR